MKKVSLVRNKSSDRLLNMRLSWKQALNNKDWSKRSLRQQRWLTSKTHSSVTYLKTKRNSDARQASRTSSHRSACSLHLCLTSSPIQSSSPRQLGYHCSCSVHIMVLNHFQDLSHPRWWLEWASQNWSEKLQDFTPLMYWPYRLHLQESKLSCASNSQKNTYSRELSWKRSLKINYEKFLTPF